jgi:ABC-2 type transport system permease protein
MRIGLGAIFGFLRREIADLTRQPTLVLLTVLGPFLILLAFGAGYRDERLVLRTVFVGPPEQAYEELLERYEDRFAEFIDNRGFSTDVFAARQDLEEGDIDAIVVFPLDPMAEVLAGERSQVTVIHDQLNPIQQVAVEFVVRIATDEVNQAVVEQLLVLARDESRPYRDTLDAIDERRGELRAAGADQDEALGDLRESIDRLRIQTAALDRFWTDYGGGESHEELARFRRQLDTTADALDEAGGRAGGPTDRDLEVVDGELGRLSEAATIVEEVEPAVLARPFVSETETLSAVDIDETDFYGAAAVALLLQHLAMSLGALTFVRDRAMGLFELVRVGPIGAAEALVGKLVAFLVVGAAAAAALLAGLHYLLDVPLLGEVWWLAALVALLLLSSIALGFVLSLLARSDTQAVQYAMLVLLASLFFSGFFIDHERFEAVVSAAARALPVTSAINGIQDVMLRGRIPEVVDLAVLAGLAVAGLVIAWMLLRRELRTA